MSLASICVSTFNLAQSSFAIAQQNGLTQVSFAKSGAPEFIPIEGCILAEFFSTFYTESQIARIC